MAVHYAYINIYICHDTYHVDTSTSTVIQHKNMKYINKVISVYGRI